MIEELDAGKYRSTGTFGRLGNHIKEQKASVRGLPDVRSERVI